jgi:hypothetical protein
MEKVWKSCGSTVAIFRLKRGIEIAGKSIEFGDHARELLVVGPATCSSCRASKKALKATSAPYQAARGKSPNCLIDLEQMLLVVGVQESLLAQDHGEWTSSRNALAQDKHVCWREFGAGLGICKVTKGE